MNDNTFESKASCHLKVWGKNFPPWLLVVGRPSSIKNAFTFRFTLFAKTNHLNQSEEAMTHVNPTSWFTSTTAQTAISDISGITTNRATYFHVRRAVSKITVVRVGRGCEQGLTPEISASLCFYGEIGPLSACLKVSFFIFTEKNFLKTSHLLVCWGDNL